MRHPTCTAPLRGGRFCDAPSNPDMPFPICSRHAIQVYRRCREVLEAIDPDKAWTTMEIADIVRRARDRKPCDYENARQPVIVYYLRIGNLIKIGCTANLRERLRQYPPNTELLATEPGSWTLERQRHSQFRHLRERGNEWYRPDPELLDHVAAIGSAA